MAMASEERRQREMVAVRGKILDAARDLFVRHGYEQVSLRKIADAIDYTAPALYTHFRDKGDLLRALCRRDFGELSENLLKMAKIADPVQRIAKFGHAYIRFAVEHPNQYRFMFMTPHPEDVEPDAESLAEKDNPERDGYAALRATVAEAIAAKKFGPAHKDAELITQVFWSGVHGVAALHVTHAKDPWIDWRSLDRRSRLMVDGLLLGMLSEHGAKEYRA